MKTIHLDVLSWINLTVYVTDKWELNSHFMVKSLQCHNNYYYVCMRGWEYEALSPGPPSFYTQKCTKKLGGPGDDARVEVGIAVILVHLSLLSINDRNLAWYLRQENIRKSSLLCSHYIILLCMFDSEWFPTTIQQVTWGALNLVKWLSFCVGGI